MPRPSFFRFAWPGLLGREAPRSRRRVCTIPGLLRTAWPQSASAEEAGDTRTDKYVGLFYFICHDDPQNGGTGTLIDNSKVFAEGGLFAVWEMLLQDQTHVWGEPYFGYYVNTDEWVYRKHAAMFSALNIDFIFVDLSNSFLHGEGLFILFETWHKIREEGGTTPQIALFCGWRPSTAAFYLGCCLGTDLSKRSVSGSVF